MTGLLIGIVGDRSQVHVIHHLRTSSLSAEFFPFSHPHDILTVSKLQLNKVLLK